MYNIMPRKVTPEVVEMMGYMRREGESVAEIADKLSLSYETVLKYLREGGFFERLKRKLGLKCRQPVRPLMF